MLHLHIVIGQVAAPGHASSRPITNGNLRGHQALSVPKARTSVWTPQVRGRQSGMDEREGGVRMERG